ncbi:hypothetical protein GH810_13370 [Acetobacterium paludosum]|uniref:Transglutaminase-like domain-containing protein n=1 Tax=Acetobacterium paludosum TaxID=52693 RepID=A0A923I5D0_9FIRM|nr:transglutaminase domain-containing protein [Acetobacterium paludosum]MBC3889305.1 hypothetical protein [Acetobacterium paludosum]
MGNHKSGNAAAIIIISMLIILLLSGGIFLAIGDLTGMIDIASLLNTVEGNGDQDRSEIQAQKYDAYSFLNTNEKQAYAKVVDMLSNYDTEVKVNGVTTDEVERVLSAIDYDHPEIFWIGEMSYYFDETDHSVSKVMVTYPYNEDVKNQRQAEIDAAVADYRTGMTADMDEYEKVKYTYEYVIRNTVYREDPQDDQNIYSVFGKKASVCAGYSKAIQYLLKDTGIECSYVAGEAIGQGAHAWNIVRVDGEYYYLDATWGEFSVEDNVEPEKSIFYDFFCVTTAELEKSHQIDQTLVQYPELTATAANYFVRENKRYDLNQTEEQNRFVKDIETAINQGEKYFHYAIMDSSTIGVAEDLMDKTLGSYYWFSSDDSLSNTIELY